MTRRSVLAEALRMGGLFGGILLVSGCGESSSESNTLTLTAEQQAAIDKANRETAEAHKVDNKKRKR